MAVVIIRSVNNSNHNFSYIQKMKTDQSYFQHFTFGLDKVINKVFVKKRREVFECFMRRMKPTNLDTVLDIGVSEEEHPSSNMFEKLYPHTNQVTAVGVGSLKCLEDVYSGLKFVQADGRRLPFLDNSFDYVYSHAVIEHVGSREQQLKFIEEAFRVAKKGIFVTTPNRLHPIEFHTAIPLVHYLPHNWYRKLYKMIGKEFYSQESNLNLLTEKELLKLADFFSVPEDKIELHATRFMLFKANLILIIKK